MALFVLSLCSFDISVGVGAFVIGLSQISSFFSYMKFRILEKIDYQLKIICMYIFFSIYVSNSFFHLQEPGQLLVFHWLDRFVYDRGGIALFQCIEIDDE